MRSARRLLPIGLASLFLGGVGVADAAQGFHGRILDAQGKAVSGAVVSARNAALARTTTVYADEEGRYRLPDLVDGPYDVRARHFGFKDRMKMAVPADGRQLDLRLAPESDDYDRMAALPSNRWFALALAAMPNAHMREEFERQCTFCHQQGSWPTRVERTPEQWEKIFSLMARMGAMLSPDTRKALPTVLNAAYDHNTAVQKLKEQLERDALPTGAGLPAVIDEWEIGTRASFQHDVVVHPAGLIYAVDMTQDTLNQLDPRTGARKAFKIPDAGLPPAGVFEGVLLPPPNANMHVGPHSLQVAPDGKIWVTLPIGNKIGIFDPRTETWNVVDQANGLYPHTLRFDAKGRAWYTLAGSNQVGMIDPKTFEQRTIRLPARTYAQAFASRFALFLIRSARWFGSPETVSEDFMGPVPYGIDIAPDGGVWFSQLNLRRIGRIDPDTGTNEIYDPPFPAPRRLRFDSEGNLWIPGFSAGVIARFNPKTKAFQTWDLPTRPKGSETPYAVNVDRKTDTVWICGTNSDTLIRFDPKIEKFTVYPMPTRVTYTREIDFDNEGGVWTSNSNHPGWQIETSSPQIIRLLENGMPKTEMVKR